MGCMEDICYVKESALSQLKTHICDPFQNAYDLGTLSDIVKDMSEAAYYCSIVDAMNKPGAIDPMLYGYNPIPAQQPYLDRYFNPGMSVGERMGYHPEMNYRDNTDRNIPQHGRAWYDYEHARKHYTQTKSEEDKKAMKLHANKHVHDFIATAHQMYDEAEPDQKMNLRNDLQALLDSMKV